MKGVVFTMDALFALIIAAAGISILLYVNYTTQTPAALHYSDTAAILSNLAGTSVSSVANGSSIAHGITVQYSGANETSPSLLGGPYSNGSSVAGPLSPILAFQFDPHNTITTGIVAAYGKIYFAAGSTLYAVNATTNAVAWTFNAVTSIGYTPALYNGMIFFANSTNLTAANAGTGAVAWSTNSIHASGASLTSPILAYDNQLIFGMNDAYVHAYYASNGTSYWSNYTSTSPVALAIVGGDVAAQTSSGGLYIIVHAGATAKQVYSKTFASGNAPTAPAGSNTQLFFGTGEYANSTYVNGTTANNFPVGIGESVTGTAQRGNYTVYQASGGVAAVSPGGSVRWTSSAPSAFGSAVSGAVPAVTATTVYTLWSNGLAAQNLSTGSLQWFAGLQGSIGPYITLAYGRLYIVYNNEVFAYGSCFAPQGATLLAAISTMYVNSQSGCGEALLNNMYPSANYSFFAGTASTNTLQAAYFNGASSYVASAAETGVPFSAGTRTIVAWVNASSYPSSGDAFAVAYGGGGNGAAGDSYSLGINSTGYVTTDLNDYAFNSTLKVPLNSWHMLVSVYSGTGTYVTLYMDSNSPQTGNVVTTPDTVQKYFYLGKWTYGGSFFSGYMADVQVYYSALSNTQVAQLFAEGAGGAPLANSGIVSWYPLAGDTNDYAGLNPGLGFGGLDFATTSYNLPALSGAYIVSKSSIPLPVLNYTTGSSNAVSVGVYSWS